MEHAKKIPRIKKGYYVLIIVTISFVTVLFAFAQFTAIGYRMTAPLRSFTEVSPNVYIHNDFTNNKQNVVNLIEEAKVRVSDFFGELESSPMIIICDDKKQ